VVDRDSTEDKKVFNRTVTLRDNWSKAWWILEIKSPIS
jgi:hypothetical protein